MNESKSPETAALAVAQPAEIVDLMDMTPRQVLDLAVACAKVLQQMIDQNKEKVLVFNKEHYLRYQHWQTIGKFYHVGAATEDATYIEIGGHRGFRAKGKVVDERTGLVVGTAEAYCMDDEPKWSARTKYEWHYVLTNGTMQAEDPGSRLIVWEDNPDKPGKKRPKKERVKVGEERVPLFQLASMAQTRAGSKALSNKFRYVAVLAGYQPTPAEEVEDLEAAEFAPAAPAAAPAPQRAPVQAPQRKPVQAPAVAAALAAQAPQAGPRPADRITEDQQVALFARLKRGGIPSDILKRYMAKQFKVEESAALTLAQLERTHEWLDQLNIAR